MVTQHNTEVLPSGLLIEQIPQRKKRQRSYYYKRITVKGGDMVWVRTELLPSDTLDKAYYLSKGFRLDPPEGTVWAKDLPPKSEDTEKIKLIAQVEELTKELQAKNDLELQIQAMEAKIKTLTESEPHSGKKGRPKKTEGG